MMADRPKYFDIRQDLWTQHWDMAQSYDAYLSASPADKADKWRNHPIVPIADDVRDRLAGYGREMNVLVSSGIWCGDCARQGPMFRQIADACGDKVSLRFIDRDASESLRDELQVVGAMRVPMVLFLTEDFHEIGRFGDRTLSVYRRKAEREMGAACSTGLFGPPEEELIEEQNEWIDIFERMLLMARLAPALRARHGD